MITFAGVGVLAVSAIGYLLWKNSQQPGAQTQAAPALPAPVPALPPAPASDTTDIPGNYEAS
jgi:hypothetical protein